MKKLHINNISRLLIFILISICIISIRSNVYAASYNVVVGENTEIKVGSMDYITNVSVKDSEILEIETTKSSKGGTEKGSANKKSPTITVKGKKEGTTTITYKYTTKQKNMNKKGYPIEEVTKNGSCTVTVISQDKKIEQEVQGDKEDLEKAYEKEPGENATAKEIKNYITSDKNNNNGAGLKNIANTNIDKIKKWKKTVDDLISTDSHYKSDNQYGTTKKILDAILNSSESGESTDSAIDSVDTSGAYDLMIESYERIIATIKNRENRQEKEFTDVLSDIDSYADMEDDTDYTDLENIVSIVITVITNIGMIVAVLMSAIIGIKYMLGSIEEKAEYKKDMMPYVIGAALIFGVCSIVRMLQAFGTIINS